MNKIRVSAVMYYNTLPMVYGLEKSEIIHCTDLSRDIPSVCAHKLLTGKVDVGLVPIAIIPQLKNANIFSNYCIGASGKVRTVVLLSMVPLDEIKTVILDSHSKTSIALLKILAKEYWKKDFEFVDGREGFEQSDIQSTTAGLVIGDKVFNVEKKYLFVYDLAEEWQKYTGLPFVFATWVADKQLPSDYIDLFDRAMQFGVNNIVDAVKTAKHNDGFSQHGLQEYLTHNIDFKLDALKKEAAELFLAKLQKY